MEDGESLFRDSVWANGNWIGFDIVAYNSPLLGGASLAWANAQRTDVVVSQRIPTRSTADESRFTAPDYVAAFAGGLIDGTGRLDLPLH